jgi:hypothetical protein
VLYFHEDIKPMERGDAMYDLSNLMIVTHLYTKEHAEALSQTLPAWRKLAPSSQIIVGYYQSRFQPSDFSNLMQDETVEFVPVSNSSYGAAYDTLLERTIGKPILILAPYAVPKEWFIGANGSLLKWFESYAIIGRYKQPRILVSDAILMPLVAPVIVELGRLQMDCIAVREDVPRSVGYHEWWFGSILVRARPGAFLLYNALAAGYPVLTLSRNCNPVRYVKPETQTDRKSSKPTGRR